jgi:hypothetical protein
MENLLSLIATGWDIPLFLAFSQRPLHFFSKNLPGFEKELIPFIIIHLCRPDGLPSLTEVWKWINQELVGLCLKRSIPEGTSRIM